MNSFRGIRGWQLIALALALGVCASHGQGDSPIRITEFMAGNRGVLADGNGNFSDWIELQNSAEAPVHLLGWHLTDDASNRRKWTFPDAVIPGGGALIVFASGLGVPDGRGQLHTNFKLNRDGGYLALVRPDGVTLASELTAYPPQRSDVSYGVAQQVQSTVLVSNNSPARLWIPSVSDGPLGLAWTGGGEPFADGAWSVGLAAIGYDGVAVASTNTVNVALGKLVVAAGETWAGLPKENLVDGNLATFTHNLNQEPAFSYLIDLGATFALASLELFNRADGCCPDRLSNFTVSILADAGPEPGPVVWSANIRTNGSNSGVGGRDVVLPTLDPTGLFTGRWIKVQARDNGTARYFQIAELRANAINWAGGASVTGDGATFPGLPAANLVDGNLATVSHNLDLTPAYSYQIRLTQAVAFERIEIWNRNDGCCPERLSAYRVSVRADAAGGLGPVLWAADVHADGSNSGVGGVDILTADLNPGGVFEGQWIEIRNLDVGAPRYLQVAEVRAFGSAGNSGYAPLIRRDVGLSMKGINASAWLRIPFVASGAYDQLTLRLRYDDGLVAYVNGVEVVRRNAPAGVLPWDASALAGRFAGAGEEISVPSSLLRSGDNVLAIHALNLSAGDRDFLVVPELRARRTLNGTNGYFLQPTPGTANTGVNVSGFVADTRFSVNRGFFDVPFDAVISCATPGATLVYTTNNSVPSLLNGVIVTSANATSTPLATVRITTTTAVRAAAFKTGLQPSDVDTQTYLFLQDVLRQPANPPGLPAAWSGGAADYAMDPKVVTNDLYRDEMVANLRSIPTLSIVLPTPDLFGSTTGIYFNSEQVGDNWERAASVELIRPDGSSGFQENCGVRVWGTGWRPNATTPKHSLQLKFKNRYGAGRLRYPLFPNAPVAEFDNLVLRAQGSRGWTDFRQPDIEQSQYIHDGWARDSAQAMGKLDGHATYVHLYLNGLYWGLYNPVEKTDEGFAEIYQGGDKSEYDVITRRGAPEVDAGTIDAWNQMMTVVNGGLESAAQYGVLQRYLEVDDFIDYMMLQQYASNHDGPLSTIANNMRAIRRRSPEGRFRFHVWDMEYTFWYPQEFNLAFDLDQCPARIFQRLRANPEFRLRWADHANKHLLGGGALTPGPAAERWRARADELVGAVVGESARWGDVRRNPPYTRNVEWTNELNRLLNDYFPTRAEILLNQYRLAGLYPAVAAPVFNPGSGDVPAGTEVDLEASAGTIYFTVDGSDPRLAGGAVAPGALAHRPTTTLVSSNSVVRVQVPTDNSLGTTWVEAGFSDASWTSGPNAVGFDLSAAIVPVNVPLQSATADFSETARGANLAIDGQALTTGWGIFENQSYLPKGRGAVAVFETVSNVGYVDGTRLTFILRHGVAGQLALGKFRLAATTDDRALFADGQTNRGDIAATWLPLRPVAVAAAGGATASVLLDGAVLIGGVSPTTNTYEVTVVTPLVGITGFRVEALEDGSLPSNGPGRAANGNAVLTDFVVLAAPATIASMADPTWAATLPSAMASGGTAGAYWRVNFDVDPGLVADQLILRIGYDDGFVAYLNGQEIARRNAPAAVSWNSVATADREKRLAMTSEEIDVTAFRTRLSAGVNVLAVHGLNSAVGNPDFLLRPELLARTRLKLPVTDGLNVKARVQAGAEWSALAETTFGLRSPLRVTEIMYDPPGAPGVSGDEFEFLEIQNAGQSAYGVSQFTFSSGLNFTFPPGTILRPGQFYLLVRNPAAFATRYPGVAYDGVYSGRLDNQGETIAISRPFNGGVVLSVAYDNGPAWPQAAAGLGFSLVPASGAGGPGSGGAAAWKAGGASLGSPGAADVPAALVPVVINEVLTASAPPASDWIELFNPSVLPANVGGWFLTDDSVRPMKYRIPDGTVIAPGGFLVLSESQFNSTPGSSNSFTLSSRGEAVFLFSGNASSNLTGYSHGFEFEAAAEGVSFGRFVNSVGEVQFPPQAVATPGAANAGPRVGPVVLSEIHYHPALTGDAFIELRNIAGTNVALFDALHPTNTWRINGVDFQFPPGVTLAAGGIVLVVSSEAGEFRARHGVPASVAVFGPFGGSLQDSGERLELKRPDLPDTNGVAYLTVDAVRYDDRAPWPVLADGRGPSLQRRALSAYADDPTNWVAAAATPGRIPATTSLPAIVVPPANQTAPRFGNATFAVQSSGAPPLRYQWRWQGTNLPGATNATLTLSGLQFNQAGAYSVVVFNEAGSVESAGALLTIFQAANIVTPPRSVQARPGSNVLFSVFATSTEPLRYQWQFNGVDLPGATGSSLALTNVGLTEAGRYTVRVDDGIVSVLSPPASLVLLINPTIIQPPLSQSVVAGANVTLSVRVTNTATSPIGYRWRRGSVTLKFEDSTQTVAYFLLTNVQATATYSVVVTNAASIGGILSAGAAITVVADSDGDGLPDEWELANGLNPSDPADANADVDGDTMTARAEYIAGTNPRDAQSYLRVDPVGLAGFPGGATLTFNAVSNRTYAIEFTDALGSGAWNRWTDVEAAPTNRVQTLEIPGAVGSGARTYRLVTPRPTEQR